MASPGSIYNDVQYSALSPAQGNIASPASNYQMVASPMSARCQAHLMSPPHAPTSTNIQHNTAIHHCQGNKGKIWLA